MSDLIKHYRQLVGIAKGWATKNLAGWSEESHRDMLARYGAVATEGRVSASTMSVPQLGQVLDDYERRGWPRRKQFNDGQNSNGDEAARPRSVPPRIAQMVKLWGKLGQAGKVETATRAALLIWCKRQVNRTVPDLDSLTVSECQKLIEALKSWLGRD